MASLDPRDLRQDASNYQLQRQSDYDMLQGLGLGHYLEPSTMNRIGDIFYEVKETVREQLSWLTGAIKELMPTGILGHIKGLFKGSDTEVSSEVDVDTVLAGFRGTLNNVESDIRMDVGLFKQRMANLLPAGVPGLVSGSLGYAAPYVSEMGGSMERMLTTPTNIARKAITKKGGVATTIGLSSVFGFLGTILKEDSRNELIAKTKADLLQLKNDLITMWEGSRAQEVANVFKTGYDVDTEKRETAWAGLKENARSFTESLKEAIKLMGVDVTPFFEPLKEWFTAESVDEFARFAGTLAGDTMTKAIANLSALVKNLNELSTVEPELKGAKIAETFGPLMEFAANISGIILMYKGVKGMFAKEDFTKGKSPFAKAISAGMGYMTGKRKMKNVTPGKMLLAGGRFMKHPAAMGAALIAGSYLMSMEDAEAGEGGEGGYQFGETYRKTVDPALFDKISARAQAFSEQFSMPEGDVLSGMFDALKGPAIGERATNIMSVLEWFVGMLANMLGAISITFLDAATQIVIAINKLTSWWPEWLKPEKDIKLKDLIGVNPLIEVGMQSWEAARKEGIIPEPAKFSKEHMKLNLPGLAPREVGGETEKGSSWGWNMFKERIVKPLTPIFKGAEDAETIGSPPQASLAPGYMGRSSGSGPVFNLPQINIYSQPGMSEEALANATTRQLQQMLNNTVQDLADREVA